MNIIQITFELSFAYLHKKVAEAIFTNHLTCVASNPEDMT